MTIRQTVALTVVANAVLFLLGIIWFPSLLIVQGFISVIALGVVYYWVAQLEDDVDKKRDALT